MKISGIYGEDASDQWFTMEDSDGSIHDKLRDRGYKIVERKSLGDKYSPLTVPIERETLSFDAKMPRPRSDFVNTFLTCYHCELASKEYQGESMFDVLSRWLDLMPGKEKYVASLYEHSYLFATNNRVALDDVIEIASSWDIDCFIGVFDDSGKMMIVFDAEFGVIQISFSPDVLPEGYMPFSKEMNERFDEAFVKEGKIRTGADQERIEEYYEKIVLPARHESG